MPEFVKRSYNFEIRADEESGAKIVGRPIVYDSKTDLGWCDEIIARGALDSADLSDVKFFVNHDISKIPLARARKGFENSTMRFILDERGMVIEVDLDIENNAEARALYSAVKRGDVDGMSFMFSILEEEYRNRNTAHPTRIINKIDTVVEVSAVNFPAYADTEISARNKQAAETESRSKELELLKAHYLYNI